MLSIVGDRMLAELTCRIEIERLVLGGAWLHCNSIVINPSQVYDPLFTFIYNILAELIFSHLLLLSSLIMNNNKQPSELDDRQKYFDTINII